MITVRDLIIRLNEFPHDAIVLLRYDDHYVEPDLPCELKAGAKVCVIRQGHNKTPVSVAAVHGGWRPTE